MVGCKLGLSIKTGKVKYKKNWNETTQSSTKSMNKKKLSTASPTHFAGQWRTCFNF